MDQLRKKLITVTDLNLSDNCWVVRAGSEATYYKHFISNGVITIGHFDEFLTEKTELTEENFKEIRNQYYSSAAKESSTKNQITVAINQVQKFIFDFKIGDLVFTVGPDVIRAGVIASCAYIETDELTVPNEEKQPILNHKLRRKVVWGLSYPKENLPDAIKRSFWANQTVFSATEHARSIYHLLMTVFISNETIYTSARIEQKSDISHYSVTQYAGMLNKIEALSHIISEQFNNNELNNAEIDLPLINERLSELAQSRKLTLVTQQSFMSPGDYWTGFTANNRIALIAFAIATSYLLGNSNVAFADQNDEVIAQEISIKVKQSVELIKIDGKIDIVRGDLGLTLPYQNQKIIKAKLSNNIEQDYFPRVESSDKGIR